MQLEESLAELRRHFSDEMSAIQATLTRSFEGRRPQPPAPLWQAEEPEAVHAADPGDADTVELSEAEPDDGEEPEAISAADPDDSDIELPEAEAEPADAAEPEAVFLADPGDAGEIESPEAEPADQPPGGLRMENLVSGVATK